jgi:hypothetical protein
MRLPISGTVIVPLGPLDLEDFPDFLLLRFPLDLEYSQDLLLRFLVLLLIALELCRMQVRVKRGKDSFILEPYMNIENFGSYLKFKVS